MQHNTYKGSPVGFYYNNAKKGFSPFKIFFLLLIDSALILLPQENNRFRCCEAVNESSRSTALSPCFCGRELLCSRTKSKSIEGEKHAVDIIKSVTILQLYLLFIFLLLLNFVFFLLISQIVEMLPKKINWPKYKLRWD